MQIDNKTQYKHQLSYFGEEFRKIKDYKLDPWQKTYIDRAKKYLLDKQYKNKKLIDIGTGSGYIAIEMAKLGIDIIACDLTPEALDNIKNYKKKLKLQNITLINCKAEEIPLKDNSVDYLVANAVLEHIPDEEKVIAEWKRILKPGGKMMITVPLSYKFIFPLFIPIMYWHDRRIGHLRRYTLSTLQKKINLSVIKNIYSGHIRKFIGFLLLQIMHKDNLEEFLEKLDAREEHIRYGAMNIIVFFKKKKN